MYFKRYPCQARFSIKKSNCGFYFLSSRNSKVGKRRISDVKNCSSQFRGRFVEITSQRRHRFVKIYWSFSTNLRLRCDVADLSEFIGHFSTNLRRRNDNRPMRRCRFVEIYWSFSTNLGHRSNIADSSQFIGHFRPILDVVSRLQTRRNLLVIFDQSATSQIRQNLLVIFDQS